MEQNTIGIKELQLNLKRVADAVQKGTSFTVMRNSKPVFRIEPVPTNDKIATLDDFLSEVNFSGKPDLSKRIDEIVYGADLH